MCNSDKGLVCYVVSLAAGGFFAPQKRKKRKKKKKETKPNQTKSKETKKDRRQRCHEKFSVVLVMFLLFFSLASPSRCRFSGVAFHLAASFVSERRTTGPLVCIGEQRLVPACSASRTTLVRGRVRRFPLQGTVWRLALSKPTL